MKYLRIVLCLTAICLLCSGCVGQTPANDAPETGAVADRVPVAKADVPQIGSLPLKDKASLYAEYDPLEPVCFYITVLGGNEADNTGHTFEQVNSYLNLQGMVNVEKIMTEVIFQVGDETGPLPGEVGYQALGSNATMNVRGRTSTGYSQKSYRIDLFDTAGMWRGQRAIAINKHPGDNTRLRNMLYFRLLQDVPGITSLRTQFVHVYVKDLTAPAAQDVFVDHGLYTQVELPNGRYLRNHGLSQNGNLYKANLFDMYRYGDQLRLATDPGYDLRKFSELLEPKTTEDHSKLLEMLDAVNNAAIPIEQIAGKYFDIDNLTSYLAFNILMANPDSDAQNYLLYSPVNSDKWYYLCWDGDGSLSYYEDGLLENPWVEGEWTKGVSNYWGVVLFNRLLRLQSFREALNEKVELLRGRITADRITGLITQYRAVVDQYTNRMPDIINMRVPADQLELIYANTPSDTDLAYENYLASLEKPMPFYLWDVQRQEGHLDLSWDASYDFAGELIYYDVQIARDWTFEENRVVFSSSRQFSLSARAAIPEPGIYYWRVVASNESGKQQTAFDQITTATGTHDGMRRFEVMADGTVVNLP